MFKRRFITFSLIASTLIGASSAALGAEVTLRMHQFLPSSSTVPKHILKPWAERVEAASEGRIEIQMFDAMALGGTPPSLIDQARDGVVDIIWTLPGYTPGRFPRTEVFELPFLMTDPAATARAYWDIAQSDMQREFAGLHLLGTWTHGPGVIHSRKPITALEDMQGVKLRAPSRIVNQLLGHMGATPVGMPVPAVPEAVSKGVIDGAVIPWEVTGAVRMSELVSDHTEFAGDEAFYTATFVFAMNEGRYRAMPEDLRAILDAQSGADFSAEAAAIQASYDAPAREGAIARGNTVTVLDEAEVARWKEASETVISNWIEEMNQRGIDGAELMARAKAKIAQYAAP